MTQSGEKDIDIKREKRQEISFHLAIPDNAAQYIDRMCGRPIGDSVVLEGTCKYRIQGKARSFTQIIRCRHPKTSPCIGDVSIVFTFIVYADFYHCLCRPANKNNSPI